MNDRAMRSGWVTFAGVAALVAGGYNLLSGIAAVADDDTLTSRATEVLYGISITGWGWFWLIAGVVQLGVGGLILARNAFGLCAGRQHRVPQRDDDGLRDLHLPAVGDRGTDASTS